MFGCWLMSRFSDARVLASILSRTLGIDNVVIGEYYK
jgi:hypothetical protein